MKSRAFSSAVLASMGCFLLSQSGCQTDQAAQSAATEPAAPGGRSDLETRVGDFLEMYNQSYQRIYTVAQEAAWQASTDVSSTHTAQRIGADQAMAAFVGSTHIIEKTREFLKQEGWLDPLSVRQLKMILLNASSAPGTIPEVVSARVAAEANQSAVLDGFEFQYQPPGTGSLRPITANQLDELLATSTNLVERQAAWETSKQSGIALRPGLIELRDLRNRVAREMGFSSFFDLQAAFFGMSVGELMALNAQLVDQMRPLYEQLHCWAKHILAERFAQPVPQLIPAHWLGNRWAQEWPGLVEGADLDPLFKDKSPQWILQQAERFGRSLGWASLPQTFWTKSDPYELPPQAMRKKNTHASAWHVDLDQDVRSLMNVRPNYTWFATTHHELGHTFYDLAYAHPGVPYVLRTGASPAFHEAMAEILATSAKQLPYLQQLGLLGPDLRIDPTLWLLNLALEQVVFVPWSAGVMAAWEHDFYEGNLATNQLNQHWWAAVAKYQGVAPPNPRGENVCDAATKTHINDDPAQYYKYALAFVTAYQLHMHIAKKILKQDPRHCNYYGNPDVGRFLHNLMQPGATRDWRQLIREATGEELSAQAMLEYFEPLLEWLKKQNAGRPVGW
jgi:peptidyl-dipeptidase A